MVSHEWLSKEMNAPKNRNGRTWMRRIAALALVLLALAAGAFWYLRGRNSRPISTNGGTPFTNFTAIATPFYLQRDPQWKDETIGSGETLAKVGCTVSSLAMAMEHFGVSFTPKTLNEALKANQGYTRRGWLLWSVIEKISQGRVVVRVLGKPTHSDIDAALQAGRPVLAKVFINHVIPHWVLVAGKEGTQYLMRDPLNEARTLTPISSYGSDIYAVRIVEPGNSEQIGR
jgi:hypothetical protein